MVDRDIVRLLHIRDAIAAIEAYAAVGDALSDHEPLIRDAIILRLEVICEMTCQLSAELLGDHPDIAAGKLAELHDAFHNNYFDIDPRLVRDVTQETLPGLKRTVEAILVQKDARSGEDYRDYHHEMPVDALLTKNRAEILRIARENGATRVRIFGSFARGTARPDSDLDLLVDFEPGRNLLDLVAVKQDIEDLVGRPVHVLTEPGISPYMRDAILRDATPL